MKRVALTICSLTAALALQASWYWPFGSDEDEKAKEPRLSELIRPASDLIDEATDLADDGKTDEAIAKYRAAIATLDKIEAENPERAKKPEFATLRNKRAFVSATIDSLVMNQARDNARSVAVTDTSALERKLAEEKANAGKVGEEKKAEPSPQAVALRTQAMADLEAGDFAAAELSIAGLLELNQTDPVALNLMALAQIGGGDLAAAEKTLHAAIRSNPKNSAAYVNMAMLQLRKETPDKMAVRRYYKSARELGAPAQPEIEEAIK